MTDELAILVRKPPQICQHCVDNSRHQSTEAGLVWCHHHMSGGVYFVATGLWQLAGPFDSEGDFKRYVLRVFTQHLTKQ